MKTTTVVAFAIAMAMAATACERRGDDGTKPVNETERFETNTVGTAGEKGHGTDGDARHFAEQAAKSGTAEVTLAQLASERAQNPEVKQFAQMMIRDHNASGTALKDAVGAHGLLIVGELPDDAEAELEKLRRLSGAEFDREYMKFMVDGHQKMLGMVTGRLDEARRVATNSPLENAVNQWAMTAQPKVEHHLQEAKRIYAQFEEKTS